MKLRIVERPMSVQWAPANELGLCRESGQVVASMAPWTDKETAARIVACVNACAGVTNDALQLMPLAALHDSRTQLCRDLRNERMEHDTTKAALDQIKAQQAMLMAAHEHAKAQRDAALAALRKMWDFASDMIETHGMDGDDSMTDENHAKWQDAAGDASAALNITTTNGG
jgi:Tfp pilus assembly major pilin PilA